MSYNSNVPAVNQTGAQTQAPMQKNFAQIQTSFSINHKPLASGGATEGFHTLVNFAAALGSDPNLAAPFTSLYAKAVTGTNQLFFQNGPLVSDVVQLTGSIISATGNDGHGGTYTVFQTPWAFRIIVGTTTSFAGSRAYTLSGGVTFGSTFYTAQVAAFSASVSSCSILPSAATGNFTIITTTAVPTTWFIMTN
jgi:hypothetical protein